jgi:hypothetical protein
VRGKVSTAALPAFVRKGAIICGGPPIANEL